MKNHLCILLSVFVFGLATPITSNAQDVKAQRVNRIDELAKEAKSMFRKDNLSGIKIFRLKGDSYMLAFGSVPARGSMSSSSLDRAASAKARAEVLKYNDGITVTEDMIVEIDEEVVDDQSSFRMSTQLLLEESGSGVVDGMQSLCTFQEEDVYVHVLFVDLNGLDTKREKRRDRKEDD